MTASVLAKIVVKDGICPECRCLCDLMTLVLDIENINGDKKGCTWTGCKDCLQERDSTSLIAALRTEDVIRVPTRHSKRRQNKKARRREECAGEDIGGRRVAGSGSQESKGDARNERWMVEDKHTSGKTYVLSKAVLAKAVSQDSKTGRNAVIRVGLEDGTNLAVCLWSDFAEEVICDE